MSSKSRRDVEFRANDGVKLRGWFYSAGPRAPAIILTGGLSCVKEQYLDNFARGFADAGIAALLYDNRCLGASEGQPRLDIDPFKQVEDYHDAISYVQTLSKEVDPSRIAIWGSSYSGGNVI